MQIHVSADTQKVSKDEIIKQNCVATCVNGHSKIQEYERYSKCVPTCVDGHSKQCQIPKYSKVLITACVRNTNPNMYRYVMHKQVSELCGMRIPHLAAGVNVARETLKSTIPEPCIDLYRKFTGASNPPEGEKVRRSSTEMQDYGTRGDGEGSPDEFENGGGGQEFDAEGRRTGKINEWQAAWNVTNAIQGMFIVSLPFAVLRGGYWAILAMVGIAHICCYTGKILVECLYEIDEQGRRVRVRDSYVAIACEAFGPQIAYKAVNSAQLIELLMTCILYVVVCGDLLAGTFPDGPVDTRSWMLIVGVFLVPLSFLKSLHAVSTLSFWCTMSHLIINFVIFAYCLTEIGDWGWSKVKWTLDFENFPISLGVIVFSYTSQIFLPTLEGNLIDRSKFDWMLDWSHIAAAAFKSLFGYVCFLTFQNDTQQVITNNLASPSLKAIVNLFLVIKAVLSYPLPYYAACELIEKSYFQGDPFPSIWHLDGELKVWALAFRVVIVLSTVLMAVTIPHFAILMGFIGSFTGTMLSFIWPCYFHIKLKGNQMQWSDIAYDSFIIFLGFLFGIIGIYDSGSALINAFKIGLPF